MVIKANNSMVWGGGVRGRVLSAALSLIILGTLAVLVYVIAVPVEEEFTEFYLLGLNGKARDYPERLTMGEPGEVVVGIINREQATTTYRVEVRIGGVITNRVGPVTLEHRGKWEGIVSFTPDKAGDEQKVEFLLYRGGQDEAYQELHLWVDVR